MAKRAVQMPGGYSREALCGLAGGSDDQNAPHQRTHGTIYFSRVPYCRACWFVLDVGMLIMGAPMMSAMPIIAVVDR